MIRPATFAVAAIALLSSTAAATTPPVTFESPCECGDAHGKARLQVKNDPSTPPADASTIHAVTPSDMFSRPGPDVRLTQQSERTGIENKWFALTGRVFTSRFKMRPETKWASLSVKYRRSSSGVQFAKRFSVGPQRDSRFTLALTEN